MKISKNRGNDSVNVRTKVIFFLVCMLYAGINFSANAQCAAKNEAFNAGETLTYDLYFNWKFIWVKAGDATMKISNSTHNSKPAYKTDLLAISNKRADRFFKMRDTITSITTKNLEPLYFRKAAEEGNTYTVDVVNFAYKNGVSQVKQKRSRRDGTEILSEATDSRCIHDMLSILNQARSFNVDNFQVGHRITFPMATGKKVEEQILIYRGKKNFKAKDDLTYRCLVFSLVEMKGKKEKEVITFYITDDKNHLPVRLDMFLNFGSAKAFLKSTHGNRHPLTSIVKGGKDTGTYETTGMFDD